MNYEKKAPYLNDAINSFLDCVDKEINFNALLYKYGPEGLYMIADKLKSIADEDCRTACEQSVNWF